MSVRAIRLSKTSFAWILILPSLLVLVSVIFIPLIRVILFSFQNYNLLGLMPRKFIGLGNYLQLLLDDKLFWIAFKNTILFTLGSVAGAFLIGLLAALLLNQEIVRFAGFLRGILLIPWITPYVVVAFFFLFMFNSEVGIINYVLKEIGIIDQFKSWLGDPNLAMLAIIIANVWRQFPFYMLTIVAGLQTVSKEEIEAASIDGAGSIQRFRYIILPHVQNVFMMVTSLMVIWNFKNFALIWTMTRGGPVNATTTSVIYVYQTAFEDFNIGYAATIGVINLLLLMFFTFIYIRSIEKEI